MINISFSQGDAFRVGCRPIRGKATTAIDASSYRRADDARSIVIRAGWTDQSVAFVGDARIGSSEREDAKRSLNGIFAISTISADHDDSDDAVDLDTYLLRRWRNIESALRHALENQK